MLLAVTEPRAALWTDRDVLQLKAEKAVAAIFAVGETLASTAGSNSHEDEFLALLDWAQTVNADAFRRVFTEPRAYHWARLAFQLLDAKHNGSELPPTASSYLAAVGLDDVEEGFHFHLQQFKLFVLALGLANGSSISFTPFPVRLPLAIPATPWSFAGTSDVQLKGINGQAEVEAIVDGRPTTLPPPEESKELQPGLFIYVAPQFSFDDHALVLQPHAMHIPGLSSIASVVPAGVPFQWSVLDLVHQALSAMQRYAADSHQQFMEYMRVIALKPESPGNVYNTSCSRLPGAAIFTAYHHPLVLAEDFLHEFFHNRLFALEESAELFASGDIDPVQDEQFYSPWRNDPRPLYGLFHAGYVFDRVLGFWLNVLRDNELDKATRQFAESRVAHLSCQLQMATCQLRSFAPFTELGKCLFEEIAASVEQKSREVRLLGIQGDVLAWRPNADGSFSPEQDGNGRHICVDEIVRQHIEHFDVFHRRHTFASQPGGQDESSAVA